MIKKLTPLLMAVLLFGCSEAAITEPREEVSSLEAMQIIAEDSSSEIFLSKGNSGKVTVCHFPPGNNGNAQVISVSGSALDAHLAHEGDGVVGVDYDENCEPLAPPSCPCWANGELDDITWNFSRENSLAFGVISVEATDDFPFGQRASVFFEGGTPPNSCNFAGVTMGPLPAETFAICEADLRGITLVDPEE